MCRVRIIARSESSWSNSNPADGEKNREQDALAFPLRSLLYSAHNSTL
jgi:hypothetical protein